MRGKKSVSRGSRVSEALKEALSLLLLEVKDPRVDYLTSVLRCEVSRDLKYCKVYYSVMGDEEKKAEVKAGLTSAAGFLRSELARRLNMRQTPLLTFVEDTSIAYSMYLDERLRDIRREDEKRWEGMSEEAREKKLQEQQEAEELRRAEAEASKKREAEEEDFFSSLFSGSLSDPE